MQFHFDVKNIVYASLCLVCGLLNLFAPKAMWKMEHLLTAGNSEPPENYKVYMRVGGAVLLIAAVALLLVNFNK